MNRFVFRSLAGNAKFDRDIVCSNIELRVDSREICIGIISVQRDGDMKAKVGKAFQKASDMAGAVRHTNKLCSHSGFGARGLFL